MLILFLKTYYFDVFLIEEYFKKNTLDRIDKRYSLRLYTDEIKVTGRSIKKNFLSFN